MESYEAAFQDLLRDLLGAEASDGSQPPAVPPDHSLVLLMGLDDSGKTTLSALLAYGDVVSPPPSGLFDDTAVRVGGRALLVRELGGRFRFREDWPGLFDGARAVVWVVDSRDRGRIVESREELDKVLSHPLIEELPVLVVLNKRDARTAMPYETCYQLLGLERYEGRREMKIIMTQYMTGENLLDGFLWIVEKMNQEM